MNKKPSFKEEKLLWQKDFKVFGIDEVGRGSFAGPLVGAAVSFDKNFKKKWLNEIKDSKMLTHKKRAMLAKFIFKHCVFLIEAVDIETINKIGIGKSNSLLFKNLIQKISRQNKECAFLIDGRKNLINQNSLFLIKGDNISFSIAAASIIAKVYRDDLMRKLARKYKGYNFYKNKGYGTLAHQKALNKYGLSEIHRTSFNLSRFLAH